MKLTRPIVMGLLVLAITLGMIVTIRLVTPEDRWVCSNGTWVQHGHPAAEKPDRTCR